MCESAHNIVTNIWVIIDSNKNNKVECHFRDNGETLQGPCMTVTQE